MNRTRKNEIDRRNIRGNKGALLAMVTLNEAQLIMMTHELANNYGFMLCFKDKAKKQLSDRDAFKRRAQKAKVYSERVDKEV